MVVKPWSCQVPNCPNKERRHKATSALCQMHYRRFRKYGDVRADVPKRLFKRPCSASTCGNMAESHGLCAKHRYRENHNLPMEATNLWGNRLGKRDHRLCDVAGCERGHKAKGLCNMHRARQLRGLPLEPKEVENRYHHKVCNVPKPPKYCTVEGCNTLTDYALYCHPHYEQHRRQNKVVQTDSLNIA